VFVFFTFSVDVFLLTITKKYHPCCFVSWFKKYVKQMVKFTFHYFHDFLHKMLKIGNKMKNKAAFLNYQ